MLRKHKGERGRNKEAINKSGVRGDLVGAVL
jgi:hypothetical protein